MQLSWLTFKQLLMKLWLISKKKKPQATSFLTLLIFLLQFQLKPIKELHELIQKISKLNSVSFKLSTKNLNCWNLCAQRGRKLLSLLPKIENENSKNSYSLSCVKIKFFLEAQDYYAIVLLAIMTLLDPERAKQEVSDVDDL